MRYGTGGTAFANPEPGLDPEELSTESARATLRMRKSPVSGTPSWIHYGVAVYALW